MPTGGGKSLCYQLPAIELNGLSLVISPLISLMKDQVDQAREMGIKASYLNSTLDEDEVLKIYKDIEEEKINLLYLAPERLDSRYFVDLIKSKYITFIAIDEAHCISQWGHDFRPSYRKIRNFIENLNKRPVIGAFTATATETVREDIINELGLRDPFIKINSFDRPNIRFSIKYKAKLEEEILRDINREDSIIIYCSTRRNVENLAAYLREKGYKAGAYHAGMDVNTRTKTQDDFVKDKINIIVATNAFGMGINKADVRKVIHANMPKSLEAYYQEAGRAGRDGDKAQAILYYYPKDVSLARRLIALGQDPYALRKLNSMVAYTNETSCLRAFILNYFGEKSNPCNNCSACIEKPTRENITVQGQMILSCIYRLEEGFGIDMVARVLKGSRDRKILERSFDKLSTFGLMKNYDLGRIKDMINYLLALDYISMDAYQCLKLNQKSLSLLKNKEEIYIRSDEKKSKVSSAYKEDNSNKEEIVNEDLYEELRDLRNKLAAEKNLPPYTIFHNSSLRAMAKYLPRTAEEFIQIPGVGYKKLENYGVEFLQVINEYIEENKIDPDKPSRVKIKNSKIADILSNKKIKFNKGHTYYLYNNGLTIGEIANLMGYKEGSIIKFLIDIVDEGYSLNYREDLDENKKKRILEAIEDFGLEKLKPIKEALGDNISYDEINLAILEEKIKAQEDDEKIYLLLEKDEEAALKDFIDDGDKDKLSKKFYFKCKDLTFNQSQTLEFYNMGLNYKEIAKVTGFKEATILNHLIAIGDKGYKINFQSDLPAHKKDQVLNAMKDVGYNKKLRPIKKLVDYDISLNDIKFVILEYLSNNNPTEIDPIKNENAKSYDRPKEKTVDELIEDLARASSYTRKQIYKFLSREFGKDEESKKDFLLSMDFKRASDILGQLLKEEEEDLEISQKKIWHRYPTMVK